MEDLGGGGIVGSGDATADVGLVRAVAHEGEELAVDEHRAAITQSGRWLPPAT